MAFDYDAFFSFHPEDAAVVEAIARRLRQEAQLLIFLDPRRTLPGEPWSAELSQVLDRSATYVGFVGPHSPSPWTHPELAAALKQRVQAHMLRLIFVRLPGGDKAQEPEGQFPFPDVVTWVDFDHPGQDDAPALERLQAAICGYTPASMPSLSRVDRATEPTPTPQLIHALLPGTDFQPRPELDELRAFWSDETRRGVLALVGLGGSGKTALICRFLQELPQSGLDHPAVPKNSHLQPAERVFVWSFYDQPNIELFIRALHQYLTGEEITALPARDLTYRVIRAMEQSRWQQALLVLDGLEVVQERRDSPGGFGLLRDSSLRHLVRRVAQGDLGFKMLLTSRFPLPELSPFLDSSYWVVEADRLDPASAHRLLRARGVSGIKTDLDRLIGDYGMHALTLDHLGTVLRDFFNGDPHQAQALPVLESIPDDGEVENQARRLARVFSFYEQYLPGDELNLLKVLCVFRLPVVTSILHAILTDSRPERPAGLPRLNEVTFRSVLAQLHRRGLISFYGEGERTLCAVHPSVRDYFYQALGQTSNSVHAEVREHLTPLMERPQREQYPLDGDDLDSYEELIYHTANSGDGRAALMLYEYRLGGYRHLAWRLADYQRGLRLTSLLIEARGPLLTPYASPWHDHSLFQLDLGQPALAETQLRRLLTDYKAQFGSRRALLERFNQNKEQFLNDKDALDQLMSMMAVRWPRDEEAWFYYESVLLQSLCDALLVQGRLVEAEQTAGAAITGVSEAQWLESRDWLLASGSNPFGRRAAARSLLGQVAAALTDFDQAVVFHDQLPERSHERVLFGGVHIAHYALLLVRLGRLQEVLTLLHKCDLTSARQFQPLLAAHYELAFAEVYQMAGEAEKATLYIDTALAWAMQSGHQETYARANLARARVLLRTGHWAETQTALQEVEQVARTCGFKICLVDGLVVAGHHAWQAGQLDQAAQWAGEAFELSTEAECGYQWGSGNAVHLLAEIELERGNRTAALRQANLALNIRTTLTDPRLHNTEALLKKLNPEKGAP